MSLATWKEEFYPVDAENVEEKDAIDHSINKWIGLLSANRKRHGINLIYGGWTAPYIADKDDVFDINGSTCALCQIYMKKDFDAVDPCENCTIVKALGETCGKEYLVFADTGRPTKMIRLLQRVKEKIGKSE